MDTPDQVRHLMRAELYLYKRMIGYGDYTWTWISVPVLEIYEGMKLNTDPKPKQKDIEK